MESNEKKYTLEDVKASTQEAEAARYRFVGCMYKGRAGRGAGE